MKNFLIKIDKFFDSHTTLWFFICLVIILRIPNFFEPYWYGDEGIYLTVGQSIRGGEKLYTEIVDHKTPIIYYLATVPNQFYFRVLLLVWMVVSTALVYSLSRKFFKNKFLSWITLLLFVVFTTIPCFEGNIPNGELFVLGFILAGLWLLSKTQYLAKLFFHQSQNQVKNFHPLNFLAGLFLGLGFLTKVPALTDFAAVLLIPWFIFSTSLLPVSQVSLKKIVDLIKNLVVSWLPLILGFFLIVGVSIAYFVIIGSGKDYLQFGLLYNLHYTQTWQLDLGSKLLNFAFSMMGKTLILAIILVALTLIKNLSTKLKFFLGWSALSIYAVLLSNRPYPHYFIQAVLPLSFLITNIVEDVIRGLKTRFYLKQAVWSLGSGIVLLSLGWSIFTTLNFKPYSTDKYYSNFYQLATGELTQENYYLTFNELMTDNYQLAKFLKQAQTKNLFIWGTNPMLYALSQTIPVGRFTVAFHIQDLGVYDETFQAVTDLKPKYIVVMNDAPAFEKLDYYLDELYLPNFSYKYMTLYKRIGTTTD